MAVTTSRTRRDPIRTRRALLDGAYEAIVAHGAGVSVDVIARAAGASKSGLLHHFESKEGLYIALAEDSYERFRAEVENRIEPDDLKPGRVMRGYLRASFDGIGGDGVSADYWAVVAHLSAVPTVVETARRDAIAWHERLTSDGLDPDVAELLMRAATGGEFAASIGLAPGAANPLRDHLIELSHHPERLRALMIPATRPRKMELP